LPIGDRKRVGQSGNAEEDICRHCGGAVTAPAQRHASVRRDASSPGRTYVARTDPPHDIRRDRTRFPDGHGFTGAAFAILCGTHARSHTGAGRKGRLRIVRWTGRTQGGQNAAAGWRRRHSPGPPLGRAGRVLARLAALTSMRLQRAVANIWNITDWHPPRNCLRFGPTQHHGRPSLEARQLPGRGVA